METAAGEEMAGFQDRVVFTTDRGPKTALLTGWHKKKTRRFTPSGYELFKSG
ncbi:hypothetical protein Daudx_1549 [Candidatus Desulforudis audaxviator]|nr:hypothetical protein Daudx_1549 [Candidatus Desulforudis audaxviator]